MTHVYNRPVPSRERAPERDEPLGSFGGVLHEIDAIARRAHQARVMIARGDATTGVTALLDIEHRCRDALAAASVARR